MTPRLLDVHGHRVAALAGGPSGGSPPVVFLHGILAAPDVWLPTLPAHVRDNRTWFSLSLLGHAPGSLPERLPSADITPDLFADVLAAAIRQLVGRQPVELVGWSTGGFAAINLAARFPQMVAGLFCISAFAKGIWHGPLGLLQRTARCGRAGALTSRTAMRLLAASRPLHTAAMRRQLRMASQDSSAEAVRATLNRLHEAMRCHSVAALARLIARIRTFDISACLPRLAVPTLILGGGRDPIIAASHTRALAAAIPNAKLVMLPAAGHFAFLEDTPRYQCLLTEWLERRPQSSLEPASAA
jgi:pimeloyl-ACP methyl ester carboxylesterase